HKALTAKPTARPAGELPYGRSRDARNPSGFTVLEMQPHNSAIGKYTTKKTIQMTSSTKINPITIWGHTRSNKVSRGIDAGLSMAVGPRWRPATESNSIFNDN